MVFKKTHDLASEAKQVIAMMEDDLIKLIHGHFVIKMNEPITVACHFFQDRAGVTINRSDGNETAGNRLIFLSEINSSASRKQMTADIENGFQRSTHK